MGNEQESGCESDQEFFAAMVSLAQWREQHPGADVDKEPPDVQAKRQLVMLRLSSLQEGDKDPWMGRSVQVLVRKSTRYVVYLDQQLDVQWWWTHRQPDEQTLGAVQANVTRLTGASAFLMDNKSDLRSGGMRKTWIWRGLRWALCGRVDDQKIAEQEHLQAREMAQQIRLLIAESMAMVLNRSKLVDCERVLASAEQQILIAKDQVCRSVFFWQFVGALVVLLAMCLVAQQLGSKVFPENVAPSFEWYFAALGGAFGAFLSATSRTRSLMLEPDSGLRGLRMEAFSRALIGAGAGILVFFAFDAGLVAKAAVAKESFPALKMVLCIVAGWSERILPALLGRAETLVAGPAKKDGPG